MRNGTLTTQDINIIKDITNNKKYSKYMKLKRLKDLMLLENPKFNNDKQIINFKKLLSRYEIESNLEDELENIEYSLEIFIPIENVEQLFDEEFEKLYKSNRFKNSIIKRDIEHGPNDKKQKKFQKLRKCPFVMVYRRSPKFDGIVYT